MLYILILYSQCCLNNIRLDISHASARTLKSRPGFKGRPIWQIKMDLAAKFNQICDLTGVGMQDTTIAVLAYQKARAAGLGTPFKV